MADFDLTQTDQQVQNILNDAQGAMGASAQTTLTTEYVMLKDTSGIYHKILKSSFTEAIRDVLAGLLVNNDKGTTINQIAAIASGDFGSITPANLASVLGGILPLSANVEDLNNLSTNGIYTITDETFGYGKLIHINGAGYYHHLQVFFPKDKNGNNILKWRIKYNDLTWAEWLSIPFGS